MMIFLKDSKGPYRMGTHLNHDNEPIPAVVDATGDAVLFDQVPLSEGELKDYVKVLNFYERAKLLDGTH